MNYARLRGSHRRPAAQKCKEGDEDEEHQQEPEDFRGFVARGSFKRR